MNTPLLEIRNLSYSYPDGTAALRGASLSVPRGARVALLGENGSGKSTLLMVAAGLLKPQGGEYFYAGTPVSWDKKGLDRLVRRVGLVFQDPDVQLFAPTVYQEVAFGPRNFGKTRDEIAAAVTCAMEETGVAALRDKPPHFLSYGQKKRVAVADILALDTEVLLFDEPLAWVDSRGKEKILSVLERLHRAGKTLIVSAHDPEFAHSWADILAVLKEGRIALQGKPEQVFRDHEGLAAAGVKEPLCYRAARELDLTEIPRDIDGLLAAIKRKL